MTLKDGYGFGGFSRAPPSKQHLSTPPPPPPRAYMMFVQSNLVGIGVCFEEEEKINKPEASIPQWACIYRTIRWYIMARGRSVWYHHNDNWIDFSINCGCSPHSFWWAKLSRVPVCGLKKFEKIRTTFIFFFIWLHKEDVLSCSWILSVLLNNYRFVGIFSCELR